MGLPDLSDHVQHRFGQWESSLFVALADQAKQHLLGVDGRDGQRDRLSDSQSVGVDEREAAAINGLFQRGYQAATVIVGADVGQPFLTWLAHFFFVNNGHS